MERDALDLGTEHVASLFRKLFVPTLFGMLSISAVTVADGIFVGHRVGSDGIAAINICIPLLMIFTGLGLMVGAGCSVVASIHLARQKVKAARINVTQALLFVTVVAAVCSALILVFARPVALWLGSSAMLGEATMAVLMFTGNLVFMHYLGDDGVGAFGIACYYAPFVFMIGNAVAQSAQPIVSFNFGAARFDRVAAAQRVALATAVFCGAVVAAAFVGAPQALVGLFLPLDNVAAQIAVEGFPLFAAGFVCFVVNLTAIGYYQSLERVRPATGFALLRGIIFLVPVFVLLPRLLGTPGIWLAMPLSETLTLLAIGGYALRKPER